MPRRTSTHIWFDSAKKSDPNNIYSEACADKTAEEGEAPSKSDEDNADTKCTHSKVDTSIEYIGSDDPPSPLPAPGKHQKFTADTDEVLIDEINSQGFLKDVAATIGTKPTQHKLTQSDKTQDICAFFDSPFTPAGLHGMKRNCKKCKSSLMDSHSTLHHHCKAYHQAQPPSLRGPPHHSMPLLTLRSVRSLSYFSD
ncbi:hypothetical protein BOTBODRAFT_182554 [Botryobasidium botryosum FD-172 SS1]|uniref:C2H2-type domain-containing protein n=1 Tax=Botryobasidium botryosum (strain FD-172 SS1) TaxID=930990 RepID=A0A067LQI1_BOTB1|nr:hypothetical protein BOTBODRAFT_182554 [Botryobasidium botryosum FD-172 SS1]